MSFSEMRKLKRALERDGFVIAHTPGGHICVRHTRMDGIVFGPSTPSDHRSIKNMLGEIRRRMRSACNDR